MKICVEIDGLGDESVGPIASEIEKNWAPRVAVISPEEELPAGAEGLLVIGSGREGRSTEGLLMVERIDPHPSSLEQTLFQINAKLGRMTSSDLMKSRVAVTFGARKDKISRRDLFLGLRGGYGTYTDAPFVFSSTCEAKYGCSKCVEVCPSDALSIEEGSVQLDEAKCTRCGECAAACPVSAIQLPRFSENAFLGLIDGLKKSNAPRKMLVLTCDGSKVDPLPWTYVEQVKDVGIIGSRQIAIAAGSGLAGVIVYCADGSCEGLGKAREATESIRSILREDPGFIVEFLEGEQGRERIKGIQAHLHDRNASQPGLGREPWAKYTGALKSLSRPAASATGLGLTNLHVDDTCTLCGTCVKSCPHAALGMSAGRLEFDSSKCTGCGYCAQLCPEGSITLGPLVRVSDLVPRTVFKDVIVNCARCGQPLGSVGFLKRVAALVGTDDPMMKYCPSCKQKLALSDAFRRE